MVEAALVLVPIMLAAGFVLELTRINQVRSVARLALYEAGRHASVTHAKPDSFEAAFKHAMRILFVPTGSHSSAQSRQEADLKRQIRRTGLPAWSLTVMSPTKASFRDFADVKRSRINNKPTIRNDYLAQQHLHRVSLGWPSGRGPRSGQTIFEANTLKLTLTYFHQPFVPGLQAVLRLLGQLRHDETGRAWRKGMFAIVLTHEVMMQSDLHDWW